MARRRTRRRKRSYAEDRESTGSQPVLVIEELSPRAKRLVEGGVIDLETIAGSGPGGKITSGDILHAARLMEVEQSVARIEAVPTEAEVATDNGPAFAEEPLDESSPDPAAAPSGAAEEMGPADDEARDGDVATTDDTTDGHSLVADSATFTAGSVGGEPVAPKPNPWETYNGSSEGFSERARPGAEKSWGEAEAHLAAMAQEAAANATDEAAVAMPPEEPPVVEASIGDVAEAADFGQDVAPVAEPALVEATGDVAAATDFGQDVAPVAESATVEDLTEAADDDRQEAPPVVEPAAERVASSSDLPAGAADTLPVTAATAEQWADEPVPAPGDGPTEPDQPAEVMMDFGTLELVDPESVWAEGAEDFAPWFLAHSRQLGDVLGLQAGLNDARQFTTKSATGVVGRDDNGEDVVVVSSSRAVAEDSDLGRALGMAASSGAASVALVSAALHEDQLKALAWLNNQTKSGVKWYGIEMQVVRIADSPAAMLFNLVASPPRE